MASEKPLVYLLLGAAGSGRREILVDLVQAGLAETDTAAVMLAGSETPSECDASFARLSRWEWRDEMIVGEVPADASHVFFVTDGRTNPVEQIEVFKTWVEAQGGELARVLCVVSCQLVEKNPPLLAWYEACVHFSDVVLLTRREGVANKWLSGFLGHFEKQFYPCLFELVKGGRVKNPALVLDPLARRMSHVFDADQEWVFTDAEGKEIDEDEETEGDEEVEAKLEEDIYFARDAAGRRAKRIPDIAKFLVQPTG
ncbi:MAG: hypothetical protein ABIZ81_14930 [Opitutaceae bacterium]